MSKRLLLFFITITFNCKFFAQQLTANQEKIVRMEIAKQFGEISNHVPLQSGKGSFCIIGGDTLLNPIGYHYVFKLSGDTAMRLDKCMWHGGNFGRFLFERNGKLFGLGGYGFFTTNNNLQYFNVTAKEWSFAATKGKIPAYVLGLAFKNSNYLYSLNNYKSGNAVSLNVADTFIYRLNLDNMLWERFQYENKNLMLYGNTYYLNDYCFQHGKINSLIIKPKELKWLIIRNDDFGLTGNTQFIQLDVNKIFAKSIGSGIPDTRLDTIDLEKVWNENLTKTQLFNLIPEIKPEETSSDKTHIIVALIIFVLVGMTYYLVRKQKTTKQLDMLEKSEINIVESKMLDTEKESDIELRIFNCKKTTLTSDELDEILGINHLETDSKKLKRHRILNEFEKNYPNVITRVKDSNDKRRFIYKLNLPKNE